MAIARLICPARHHQRLCAHISMSRPFLVSHCHQRFFWTYKRIFPSFFVHTRAYTGRVSPCDGALKIPKITFCFTSPQHVTAAILASVRGRLVSPYVTFDLGRLPRVFRSRRSKENRPVWMFRGLGASARGRRTFFRSSLRLPRGSVQNPSGLGITPGERIFAALRPSQGRSDCAPEPLHPRGRRHEAI